MLTCTTSHQIFINIIKNYKKVRKKFITVNLFLFLFLMDYLWENALCRESFIHEKITNEAQQIKKRATI